MLTGSLSDFLDLYSLIEKTCPWYSLNSTSITQKRKVASSSNQSPVDLIDKLEQRPYEKRAKLLASNFF